MYLNPATNSYELIGTVQGSGYNCKTDQYIKIEGSSNGLWNKVSNWVNWIREVMEDMGEPVCKA